jgi:DNA-binding response OmpR family regulator
MLVAGMLQDMLSTLGYAVAGTTADIGAAVAMLDRETIDAAVLDINLRGQMSYPIAEELAERGIPFIFSTGYNQSLPAQYEGYPLLKKPFRRSTLGAALADLLRQDQESAPQEPKDFREGRTDNPN